MQADPGAILNAEANWLFLISLPVLCWAIYTAPWKSTQTNSIKTIWPMLCGSFFLIWQMQINLMDDAVHIHLLGTCLFTVLFGWQLAVIGLSSILLASSMMQFTLQNLTGSFTSALLAIDSISLILIPVFSSYLIVVCVFRFLPKHFFIFIFLSGFFNAVISIVLVGLSNGLLLQIFSHFSHQDIWTQIVPAMTLMLFPEAFITGAVLTVFVVYKPEWVRSFNDRLYLNK